MWLADSGQQRQHKVDVNEAVQVLRSLLSECVYDRQLGAVPGMWGCGLSVVLMCGFVAHITSLTHRTAPGCSVPGRDERLDQGPVKSGLISLRF